MRFDIVTVFPEFFSVLDLSLVGKARNAGLIDVEVHDLRSWTHDVHRTVDDSPFGGGAGMVMKPDVWGQAIDEIASEGERTASGRNRTVLAIPTPSGEQLTQAACYDLAEADHIIIACGRYEGIDSRIAEHYRERLEVYEYSLGDYVLNGGEVAATALVEAVGRLVPGMVGNPQSLVEESYGSAGLLEYPVYTRPASFREIDVPEVLTSGNHAKIARWRRDRALERTARRRPDMITELDATALDKHDLAKLASLGWLRGIGDTSLTRVCVTETDDAAALADLAAETFPDACPPGMDGADIADFVGRNLSMEAFGEYLADSERYIIRVLQGTGREILGYSLAVMPGEVPEQDAPTDVVIDGVERDGPLVYLSKMYLRRKWRGTGAFDALMEGTLAAIAERTTSPEPYVWLGTNVANKRAIRAYKRAGFQKSGERTFLVGDQVNKDITLARRLGMAK